jgi:hypothetical protein
MGEQKPPSLLMEQQVLRIGSEQPRELWGVAVQGAMDPRQHHPLWYKLIGCLTEDEAAQARGIVLPHQTVFESPKYTIICSPEKWEIQTFSRDDWLRIQQVASRVFQKLSEVPASAYGINAFLLIDTKLANLAAVMSRPISSVFAFPSDGKQDSSITYINQKDDVREQFLMGVSVNGPGVLSLSCNRHRDFKATPGYFDLGAEVRKHAETDWKAADALSAQVAARIVSLAKD